METWRVETDLGLLQLAKHRPRAALGHLARALERCPERRTADLARVLFYLGVTMRKLGMMNPALRSWIACQKLTKRGLGSKMLDRYANAYGMEKQPSADEDDWQAFRSVQVRRYLRGRTGERFQSSAEAGLVTDLIRDRWRVLRAEHDLGQMSPADKCALFRGVGVEVPWGGKDQAGPAIAVSFPLQRRVAFGDRCPCGSGRSFGSCCGRTLGADEMACGVF
jgi:hypothetical protein